MRNKTKEEILKEWDKHGICKDNDYNKVEYEKWLKDPNTKIPPMTNTQCNFAKFLFKRSSIEHLEKIGNLDDIYLSIRRYIKP